MMKKFTPVGRKTVALMLVTALTFGVFISSDQLLAEEEVPVLTLEEFSDQMLEYAGVREEMEDSLDDMLDTYEMLSDMASGIEALHDQLPRYETLGKQFDALNANEVSYIELNMAMAALDPATQAAEIAAIQLQIDNLILSESLLNDPTVVDDTVDPVVTQGDVRQDELEAMIAEYGEYQVLKSLFSDMYIDDHNVSRDEEFETFVEPVKITPLDMQEGIQSLSKSIPSSEYMVVNGPMGAKWMYEMLLSLEENRAMVAENQMSMASNFSNITIRYENGLSSQFEYIEAMRDAETARINLDTLDREIENLKMSMNVARGVAPLTEFQTEGDPNLIVDLKEIDYYLEQATQNREDLEIAEDKVYYQEERVEVVGDYYSISTDKYKSEELTLDLYELELDELENDIYIEVHEYYNDVIVAKQELLIAIDDLNDAYRQLSELQLNRDIGLVTDKMVSDFNMMVIQMVNTKETKYREYGTALSNLLNAARLDYE